MSNVRGRSIISGSKDLIVNVNGSAQEPPLLVIPTSGTEQSTHRISNEKLPEVDVLAKNDAVGSALQTPVD